MARFRLSLKPGWKPKADGYIVLRLPTQNGKEMTTVKFHPDDVIVIDDPWGIALLKANPNYVLVSE